MRMEIQISSKDEEITNITYLECVIIHSSLVHGLNKHYGQTQPFINDSAIMNVGEFIEMKMLT